MRIVSALVISAVVLFQSPSDEVWMQPSGFVVPAGETVTVAFHEGQQGSGRPWKMSGQSVNRVVMHGADGSVDLRQTDDASFSVALPKEGTYVLVAESAELTHDWAADAFNEYLKENALDDGYAFRRRTGTLGEDVREERTRCTKLVLQSGTKTDDIFGKQTGLSLEITPLQHPYDLEPGESIKFRITYKGKPLFGARVNVWNLYNRQVFVQPAYSQQDGTIETTLSRKGVWMVSVRHMVCGADTGWQGFGSTLVFGVR